MLMLHSSETGSRCSWFVPLVLLLPMRFVAAQESAAIFEAPVIVVPNQQARMNALLDIDGDGFVDSVGMFFQQQDVLGVFTFLNDGSGRMLSHETRLLPIPVLGPAATIAVADFSGDGLPDWVIAASTDIFPFISNGVAPSTALPPIPIVGIGWIYDLTTGDYDGNGQPDIALRTKTHIQVYLDFARPTQVGPITLATQQDGGFSLRTGELTGDGIDDLFVFRGASGQISFFQYSAGALVPIAAWNHQIEVSNSPYACCGDLDGDSDQDIVIFAASGSYRVLRRTGPAAFTLEAFATGGPATDLADVDLDGDLDGVCCGGSGGPGPYMNTAASKFEIAINNGSGGFANSFKLRGMGANRIAGVADVDHDGDVDLVAGRVIYFNHDGIAPDTEFGITGFPTVQDFADVDGDGDLDHGATLTTFNANLGSGFATKTRLAPTPPPGFSWFGPGFATDHDGDGDIDQIHHQAGPGGAVERLFLNNGGGSLVDGGLVTDFGVTIAPTATPNCVIFVDLDRDGDSDVVSRSALGVYTSIQTSIFLRNSTGKFMPGPTFVNERAQRVADFDGDAIPDLLTWLAPVGPSLSALRLRRGLGDGTFASPVTINTEPIIGGYVFDYEVATGDWDGDGDLDVVYHHFTYVHPVFTHYTRLLENAGNGTFSMRTDLFSDYHQGALPALSGDVDGDGIDDLVLGCATNFEQSLSFYKGEVGGSYPLEYLGSQALDTETLNALLDLDEDGDADLIGVNETRNQVFHGSAGGTFRQFGAATAGNGGHKPTMGAAGPFRVGEAAELRVTGALPNSIGLLFVGTEESQVKIATTGGFAYTLPWLLVVSVPYLGNAAELGSGRLAIQYVVPPAVGGSSYIHQTVIFDAAAQGGASVTNAIEIAYGW